MSASFTEAQQRLLALNADTLPFVYEPTPEGVIARWKWADARWHNILAAGAYQQEYELRVVLDAAEASWTFSEFMSGSETNIGVSGASFSSTKFRGRVCRKSSRKDFAVRAESVDRHETRSGQRWEARFSTDDVKRPVVDALTALGWTQRRGFWSRLFGS